MNKTQLRVSLVIPAYNEESHLRACLDAVAAQTARPFEVIVVDNNSTDATAAIASSYPFVRLLCEVRQGVSHARATGFNAARGDIIGRIDVDTHLATDWVAQVQQIFERQEVDAVSGAVSYYDVPFERLFCRLDLFFRRYLARNLSRRGELFLYGGNMAIRRAVWQNVQNVLCHERSFHEDIDMAAHFAHSSYRLAFAERLRVAVSARRIDSSMGAYYPYVMANSRTYAAHGLRGRFYMYPVESLVVLFYWPLRLLYRSYDSQTKQFSLKRMFSPGRKTRVSPVADTL